MNDEQDPTLEEEEEEEEETYDEAPDSSGLAEASTGTTIAEAEAQHPGLDTSLPPGSERTPEGDELVLAQSPEEVQAQYDAAAGGGEGNRTEEGDANAESDAAAAEADADDE